MYLRNKDDFYYKIVTYSWLSRGRSVLTSTQRARLSWGRRANPTRLLDTPPDTNPGTPPGTPPGTLGTPPTSSVGRPSFRLSDGLSKQKKML